MPYLNLNTYEDASTKEASIVPIRGSKNNLKPIASRRKQNFTIRRTGENEDIVVTFYLTDIVTYKQSKEILVKLNGWETVSTIAALSAVLGLTFFRFDGFVHVSCTARTPSGLLRGDFRLHSQKENLFLLNENNCLVFQNPKPTPVKRLNRKVSNELQKSFEPFLSYTKGMCAIMHFTFELLKEGRANNLTNSELLEFASNEKNPEKQYKAFLFLVNTCWHSHWSSGPEECDKACFTTIKKHFKEVLWKHNRERVFNTELYLDGKLRKDNYKQC